MLSSCCSGLLLHSASVATGMPLRQLSTFVAAIVTDALPPSPSPHYTSSAYVCMLTDVEMSLKYMKFNMQFMQQLLLFLLLLLSSVGSLLQPATILTYSYWNCITLVVVLALNKIFLQFFFVNFSFQFFVRKEPTTNKEHKRIESVSKRFQLRCEYCKLQLLRIGVVVAVVAIVLWRVWCIAGVFALFFFCFVAWRFCRSWLRLQW